MSLAARITAEAADGDVAAAGCRVAKAQLRDDLNNPALTACKRRRRFDAVAAATKELLARTPKEHHMTQHIANVPTFDVTAPLVRHPADGQPERMEVSIRIPSGDFESAEKAAHEIAWAIVTNLPSEGDNNRYGWKIAEGGATVEAVR